MSVMKALQARCALDETLVERLLGGRGSGNFGHGGRKGKVGGSTSKFTPFDGGGNFGLHDLKFTTRSDMKRAYNDASKELKSEGYKVVERAPVDDAGVATTYYEHPDGHTAEIATFRPVGGAPGRERGDFGMQVQRLK